MSLIPSSAPADATGLAARVQALETAVAALTASSAGGDAAATAALVAEIQDRIAALVAASEALGDEQDAREARYQQVDDRIGDEILAREALAAQLAGIDAGASGAAATATAKAAAAEAARAATVVLRDEVAADRIEVANDLEEANIAKQATADDLLAVTILRDAVEIDRGAVADDRAETQALRGEAAEDRVAVQAAKEQVDIAAAQVADDLSAATALAETLGSIDLSALSVIARYRVQISIDDQTPGAAEFLGRLKFTRETIFLANLADNEGDVLGHPSADYVIAFRLILANGTDQGEVAWITLHADGSITRATAGGVDLVCPAHSSLKIIGGPVPRGATDWVEIMIEKAS